MNDLQIFNNEEFDKIRMLMINGQPYAVGNDIAKALDYKRPYEAVTDHCKGAVIHRVLTEGGKQATKVIPEGDIYRLIVKAADQSQNLEIKKKAEKFERWIFDEVLPEIRRTGGYKLPQTYPDALRELADKVEENQKLITENNILKPKANKYDEFMNIDGLISVKSTAQILDIPGVGQNKLFEILRNEKIFYKKGDQNKTHQKYINRGYFKIKETPFKMGEKEIHYERILFTPKGIDWISDYLKEKGYKKGA